MITNRTLVFLSGFQGNLLLAVASLHLGCPTLKVSRTAPKAIGASRYILVRALSQLICVMGPGSALDHDMILDLTSLGITIK